MLIVAILLTAVFGTFQSMSVVTGQNESLATPTPTPEAQKAAGPISQGPAAFAISPRVSDLPPVPPAKGSEPREINPQNTIPVKRVKSPTVKPAKSTGKKRPRR